MVRRFRTGFTLIEMMVVVAIFSILAAVAIPRFLNFTLRAKTAEARTMLGTMTIGQMTFFSTNDCFAATPPTPMGDPGPQRRSWDSVSAGALTMACEVVVPFADTQIAPDPNAAYYQYACNRQLSPPEFACSARGDLDGDGTFSIWVVCSDFAGEGCIDPPEGAASLFPFEPVLVSGTLF